MENTLEDKSHGASDDQEITGIKGFFKKHGPEIGLAVLIIYVILLGIGTIAEIFEIQWILDWWIFRSPGR